jgi:hypothetical protein
MRQSRGLTLAVEHPPVLERQDVLALLKVVEIMRDLDARQILCRKSIGAVAMVSSCRLMRLPAEARPCGAWAAGRTLGVEVGPAELIELELLLLTLGNESPLGGELLCPPTSLLGPGGCVLGRLVAERRAGELGRELPLVASPAMTRTDRDISVSTGPIGMALRLNGDARTC